MLIVDLLLSRSNLLDNFIEIAIFMVTYHCPMLSV
ncbi:hypothetical protein SPHV1_460002 [Novosphingobium sp. KN65.2]|nr:hypothetical protein SPHV1_460002 [Novosphingobium sp. KN65.2]